MTHSEEHSSTQQGTTSMRCPMCGVEFRSQTELEQHKKQAHPNK